MKHFMDKIYTFSQRFIQILMLLFTGILLISGFFLTCFSIDMESQKVLTKWDNPLLSLLGTGLLFLLLTALNSFISRTSRNTVFPVHRFLRLFVLCWCVICGIIQILFSKTVPAADAYSVYDIAQSLASGDTSVIHPTGSYLSYYPQQAGLVAFWELLIRIWNLTGINQHAYHFIKIVYIILGCVIILFQEKIVHILWRDERTDCLYLLLAGANCPFLMYISFLYGEIPSFAAISTGTYFLLRLMADETDTHVFCKSDNSHKFKISFSVFGFAAGSLLFFTLSVMLRKNSLIYIIAVVLVILCTCCKCQQHRPLLLLLAGLYVLFALAILPCVQNFYEYRSGSTINSGVPAVSYFAMGMQEASRANGWYNGFNFNTYQDTGMDTELTTAISKEAIQERLTCFKEHPGYAARFYLDKFLSQWADGTYACRQATLATFGGRNAFFTSLYEGTYSNYLIAYCNLYQNLLYGGAFWFCLHLVVRKRTLVELPVFLGLISAFGGFLFHMLWEANSRYIFLYGMFMLPYAARGLGLLINTFNSTLRRQKSP